ncbi:helix-turn-helix transcriptional regulator [Streptomyces sp. M19]
MSAVRSPSTGSPGVRRRRADGRGARHRPPGRPGLTNRQVAQRVHLSPHTVTYHLRRICGKLGIRSRIELARHVYDG